MYTKKGRSRPPDRGHWPAQAVREKGWEKTGAPKGDAVIPNAAFTRAGFKEKTASWKKVVEAPRPYSIGGGASKKKRPLIETRCTEDAISEGKQEQRTN